MLTTTHGQSNQPIRNKNSRGCLLEFKVQLAVGLTDIEVQERQKTYGLNEVPEEKQSMLLVFLKHFWGLTAFMLDFTIIVSFLLQKYVGNGSR